ncbi:BREX-1 system adenine-specific DNA-methyltransferase PglX [Psychromonas sp. CNPT3]|uniref:BREX-1 system adenine-specific DNA-methyltransferase PglX n=1 Tax=Psychromonas sp. CNPT3 TaxID=314282 RepID=UPI001E49C727|nr:BREX-1 system adenine-specific DNA-methyltransferase PglX [Psychromonas sp. CNPT3]
MRKKLENTVIKARDIVEVAVEEALQRLGVADSKMPNYLNEPEREPERQLRNKLRAHARQLGDSLQDGKQEIERLTNEMAYEHWHRMLFACYLAQNNLLMYDQYTAVTIEECAELAEEESDCKDGWELAGRLAQKMLPQIFRVDSPVFEVKLSINHVNELESLISRLDPETYQAQDSLGWCYQFWQTKKKDQVNKSGVKIGAQELSPVTQLFTEPYMVSFLLDNALGAWWANKRLTQDDFLRANNEQELRELASIPGVPLEYLRFTKDEGSNEWKPAAGGFDKWPEHLSELKTLDPCCGSGHFLVAKFLMLVPMRMQLEGLTETEAVDAVIRDNIHGLELDQRCVELAAFALALEAWRYPNTGGYRVLPELQLACSGMSITEAQKEWKVLAKDDQELQGAIKWMLETFKDAPTLGSLIDPRKTLKSSKLAPWELLQHAMANKSDASGEARAVAQGLAKAAVLLADKYQWVVTNVPYLGRKYHCERLKAFCSKEYESAKSDLATVFLMRCMDFCSDGGTGNLVLTQNWMFLSSYKKFREELLINEKWNLIGLLGGGAEAFNNGPGNITNISMVSITRKNKEKNAFASTHPDDITVSAIDVTLQKSATLKSKALISGDILKLEQKKQLDNPDFRITLQKTGSLNLLRDKVDTGTGAQAFDSKRFFVCFWEQCNYAFPYITCQSTVNESVDFSGRTLFLKWADGKGDLFKMMAEKERLENYTSGVWKAWERYRYSEGVCVSLMGKLPATLFTGNSFDINTGVIIPKCKDDLPAIWAFCKSKSFNSVVRQIDQKINVTNATLGKIPFDLSLWKKVATEQYPHGLPKPYTNGPSQWIFHGHPCSSVIWDEESKTTVVGELRQEYAVLQVAVARLLGYQWPAELDAEMELAPEMREVMQKNSDFVGLVDDDGIVCIPAVRGEKSATKRLEMILHKAYGEQWTSSVEANLLKSVKAKDLESWLRDKFFDQHSKLFKHRPFIWQIWDGHKEGFSVLVNYHKLDYELLERLIYTYLDDWIKDQKARVVDGIDGADILLAHAEDLRKQLKAILIGEKGLDIFVRWKPLAEQPIGWNPDLNDGVRLNIRPFMLAKDVGKKGAGVLRSKPNIKWEKLDRGTDVASAPWFNLGPEYGEKLGARINYHHLTIAEKQVAKEAENE